MDEVARDVQVAACSRIVEGRVGRADIGILPKGVAALQEQFRGMCHPRARTQPNHTIQPVIQDSRAHPRIPTRLKGRLLSIDGRCNLNCIVIDLSEGGARVTTANYDLVPSHPFLLIEKTSDIFECEVRWRRADGVGLSFVDSPGRVCRKALLELCRAEPV